MIWAIILIALTAILVTKGLSGCLTFILATVFIFIASYILLNETGIIVAILFSIGLAVHQIRK